MKTQFVLMLSALVLATGHAYAEDAVTPPSTDAGQAVPSIVVNVNAAVIGAEVEGIPQIAAETPAAPATAPEVQVQVQIPAVAPAPAPVPQVPQITVINDELVKDLRCDKVDSESIYRSIRSDAFEMRRRVIIKNFSDDAFEGQCWSIARTQRLNLLLGRQDTTASNDNRLIESLISTTSVPPKEAGIRLPPVPRDTSQKVHPATTQIYNFLFGEHAQWALENTELAKIYLARLEHIVERDLRAIIRMPWLSQYRTFSWPKEGRAAITKFVDAIRVAQTRLFLRKENLEFLHIDQTEGNLNWNFNKIAKLTLEKKLPLINMRWNKKQQHVVVAHKIQKVAKDHYYIGVIDSNHPNDPTKAIEFKRVNGRMTAIYGKRIDMFLVEESERGKLDRALVGHYRQLCSHR